MRCKKHPIDLSSRVGVCASCLRERLFIVIAAQAQAQAPHDCRKSETQPPPPLSFPRSVSPYISRRKSDTTTAPRQPHDHRRFYSTPQVGPNGSITVEIKNNRTSNKGRGISSLFLWFFRSKSENKPDSVPAPTSDPRVLINSCSGTTSWFSNFIPGSRKKKIQTFLIDERTCRNRGRGMSPTRYADNEDEHCQSSGYSSDSQGWKQTPRRTPASRRRGGHSKSVSGLAFCLSPLVRPSPNHHRNPKGIPPEMVVAGECRVTPKQNLPTAASLCKNRSRKLAGFGRIPLLPLVQYASTAFLSRRVYLTSVVLSRRHDALHGRESKQKRLWID
ncbi:hypothetical protein ACS0TY_003496 [Phlomoides rotata]